MNPEPLWSVLIPAVGGQGGGVLAEWIVEAALADRCLAHSTSIPGVAQRTGSTTYYVEVARTEAEPAFSLHPVPGALDVLLAPEFLEVGRAIEQGFPSPARTTIVASTHRLYSIHEKVAVGRGIYPVEQLHAGARAFSRRLLAFDAAALAREQRTEVNAVLLGALAASGVLPISEAAFRRAIEAKGVQVEANLRGFEAGLGVVARIERAAPPSDPELARVVSTFPGEVRETLAQAVARLVDYQDRSYARRYLARLGPVAARNDPELLRIVARHLAVWMTYEDAIRVADLKTRASRFDRIRAEARAPGAHLVVTDYLKPDLDEIYGVLPHRLVAPLARWAERRWPHGRPTLGQRVKTSTVTGYLRLWLLARLRGLRPRSYRAHQEHARMERWLAAVTQAAEASPELARELGRAANLVKGYGDVRRRMVACLDRLLAAALAAARLETAAGGDGAVATALARRYCALVLGGPDGETPADALAERVLARLRAADREGARATVEAVAGSGPGTS